jgi:hypothetical protein
MRAFAGSIKRVCWFMGGINIKKFKIEVGYQYGLTNVLDNVSSGGHEITGKLSSLFLGVSYIF